MYEYEKSVLRNLIKEALKKSFGNPNLNRSWQKVTWTVGPQLKVAKKSCSLKLCGYKAKILAHLVLQTK